MKKSLFPWKTVVCAPISGIASNFQLLTWTTMPLYRKHGSLLRLMSRDYYRHGWPKKVSATSLQAEWVKERSHCLKIRTYKFTLAQGLKILWNLSTTG